MPPRTRDERAIGQDLEEFLVPVVGDLVGCRVRVALAAIAVVLHLQRVQTGVALPHVDREQHFVVQAVAWVAAEPHDLAGC